MFFFFLEVIVKEFRSVDKRLYDFQFYFFSKYQEIKEVDGVMQLINTFINNFSDLRDFYFMIRKLK